MSGTAGWAALAGVANYIGGNMQQKADDERKQKLLQLQQDAEMKRQQFLIDYRQAAEEKSKQSDYDRTKDDVTSSFANPETGDVMGRTRSGLSVPLMQTSDDYKSDLVAQRQARLAATQGRASHLANLGGGPSNPNYGTGIPAPGGDQPPQQQQQQQASPTQPSAPSPDEIMAQANAAIKAGKPQAAVEARMQQLFKQYGYTQ